MIKKKYLIFLISFIFIIPMYMFFNMLIQFYKNKEHDGIINFKSNINVIIQSTKNSRGALILNDSLTIPSICPEISEIPSKLKVYHIQVPYRIIKKEFSEEIIIIKESDTLYFKLLYY